MHHSFYKEKIDTVLKVLDTDKFKGLSNKKACQRLQEYGENVLAPVKQKSILQEIRDILTGQLIIILLIAAGISFLIKEYEDGIGICLAIIIGSVVGLLTESRSRKAAEALNKMTQDIFVKVLRNGEKVLIHKSKIVPGDIVYLESGDQVPADGRIIEAIELRVREDMLTGESCDVNKKPGIVQEELLTVRGQVITQDPIPAKQYNMLFGGTFIASGNANMIVTATADDTQMGNIAKDLGYKEEDTPLQMKMDELGRKISKISTGIASMLFIYMLIQIIQSKGNSFTYNFSEIKTAFVVCVALIVAAVPEGLPTMINITLAITMKQMSKINVLVRRKEACETIGSISVICSDKTGTLTQNKMRACEIYLDGNYLNKDAIERYPYFLDNCMINSTADIEKYRGEEKYIGSATECALLSLCEDYHYSQRRQEAKMIEQMPFDSEKKYMKTVLLKDGQYETLVKGAPEVILRQCCYEMNNGKIHLLTKDRIRDISHQISLLQCDAVRVIAFAHQYSQEATNELIFDGFVGMSDPIRDGVKEAIHIAQAAGIQTKILTGDHLETAKAIARKIGLVGVGLKAVEATYIDRLSEEQLMQEINDIVVVARSKPDTKMRFVQALQKKGEIVAVTGDGINDAPALSKADVGIAMGISGTEVSKNAADIILADDSFKTIVEAVKWGRGIYNNFQRFIQFQLTVNIIAFLMAIISQLMGYEMPFSTIHLLWFNMIMDGPPALALGLEPIRDSVMKRMPIKRDANIINPFMIRSIIINSTFISVILFIQLKWNFLGATDTLNGYVNQKQTILFNLFAFSILFNALNCREFGTTSIFDNFLKNKLALRIILLTAILQVVITQCGGTFFHTVPLSWIMWLKIIGSSSLVVIGNEIVKRCLRTAKKFYIKKKPLNKGVKSLC